MSQPGLKCVRCGAKTINGGWQCSRKGCCGLSRAALLRSLGWT